jgi:hypothetical protein
MQMCRFHLALSTKWRKKQNAIVQNLILPIGFPSIICDPTGHHSSQGHDEEPGGRLRFGRTSMGLVKGKSIGNLQMLGIKTIVFF